MPVSDELDDDDAFIPSISFAFSNDISEIGFDHQNKTKVVEFWTGYINILCSSGLNTFCELCRVTGTWQLNGTSTLGSQRLEKWCLLGEMRIDGLG